MTQYLTQPVFWFSVIVVALIVNWAYQKWFNGKGKLV